MKKTATAICINLMMIFAALVGATGCSSESQLRQAIEEVNKECPLVVEDFGLITSVSYKNGGVYYEGIITEDEIDVQTLVDMWDYLKPFMVMEMMDESKTNSDVKTLIDVIIEYDVNLTYKFKDKYGESTEFVFTPDDLTKARNMSPESIKNTKVDALIQLANQNVDEATCIREGNSIVFVFPISEMDGVTLQDIKDSRAIIKQTLLSDIETSVDPIIDLCDEYDLDLVFRYTDDMGDGFDIKIRSSEIKANR